jgi:hypothetical protein
MWSVLLLRVTIPATTLREGLALALSVFRVLWWLVRVSGRQMHQAAVLLALEAVFGGLIGCFVVVFFI